MADLQLEIEGEGAVPATEELLEIDGLSGNYETEADTSKEGVLATIATIIGITVGTLEVAEKLYTWYQNSRRKKPKPTVDKVLLIGRNGQKLVLENASVEQIKKILDS
ncbi:hypothetical protein NDI45_24955 [Leptolyngbya sp. GB1-A1]|uniref:hypothetical protein n=1 Tax=Leptolyngbya sp. GB1-A1 TaxID=2933908 RepID=UPI003298C9DA